MKGKHAIEEIDFLKSQGQDRERILAALQESIKIASIRTLLRRHDRADLIEFLFPADSAEPIIHEHGDALRYAAGCRCPLCLEANNFRATKLRKERTAREKDPNDPRHGSAAFYQNHGCRCERCKAAHAARVSADYQRRLSTPIDPKDPRHGRKSFYVGHGCRCEPCKEAARAYDAKRKGK